EREIRAYCGWPRSYTTFGGVEVVITEAHSAPSGSGQPGALEIEGGGLKVHTSDGYICIDKLIPAGKKEMPVSAFLAGYKDRLKN
ncbi:MAG: methionyl-tRNA formyltransferase, partial [Patescibacteria group bacterium]